MTPKKKFAAQPEIHEAKKKARRSADEATRNGGGGRHSMVAGKSILPKTSFPITKDLSTLRGWRS
jgi:hypothetical protein